MEKQKISKKVYVSSNEYDFALMMRSYNMQIPGFRKGAFNRSILDAYVGQQAREYIKYLKLREVLNEYTDVSNARAKMHLNTDTEKKDAMFVITLEFEGIEKPKAKSEETTESRETLNENSSESNAENNQ